MANPPKKQTGSLAVVGLPFFIFGLVMLITGHVAVGVPMFGFGVTFLIVGLAAGRKSNPPDGRG